MPVSYRQSRAVDVNAVLPLDLFDGYGIVELFFLIPAVKGKSEIRLCPSIDPSLLQGLGDELYSRNEFLYLNYHSVSSR